MRAKESALTKESKEFLRQNSLIMINELQNNISQLMNIYKQNSTLPADFYALSLREGEIRIKAITDLYRRLTDEELK